MRKTLVLTLFMVLAIGAFARLPLNNFGAPDLNVDIHASLILSQSTWGVPLPDANRLAGDPRITPDDFSILAFLSSHSGLTIEAIWRHRLGGASWYDVCGRVGVPMDVVMVRTQKDFGPPYGKAWGYWKKHPRPGDRTFFLDDTDFQRMVEVHTLCKATGKGPDEIINGFKGGESYTKWAGKVGREKHGKGDSVHGKQGGPEDKGQKEHNKPADKGGTQGKGKGKGK